MSYSDLAHLITFRPLERPLAAPRSRTSPFRAPWTSTVEILGDELRAHGARRAVLEIDVAENQLRLDGLPRAAARPASSGVVLSFTATSVPGAPALRYEVATYADWRDNVRAIALGLRALRAVDRYGVTTRGEQYAGWRALPTGSGGPSPTRGHDLIRHHGSVAGALKATHPDHGGDPADFADVQARTASS